MGMSSGSRVLSLRLDAVPTQPPCLHSVFGGGRVGLVWCYISWLLRNNSHTRRQTHMDTNPHIHSHFVVGLDPTITESDYYALAAAHRCRCLYVIRHPRERRHHLGGHSANLRGLPIRSI